MIGNDLAKNAANKAIERQEAAEREEAEAHARAIEGERFEQEQAKKQTEILRKSRE